MQKEDIHIDDIKRILIGDAPVEFMIEVFGRTLLIFVILLVVVRLLGKRMAGQLTITEMAVMLTLGAIVAPAMQMPDRGILLTVVALACALLFQRGLTWLNFKYPQSETLTQGKTFLLIEDGVIKVEEMKQARVTHQQLFAKLRQQGFFSLGEVEAAYLEACGLFSIFRADEHKRGLSVLPPDDEMVVGARSQEDKHLVSCCNCGYTSPANSDMRCKECGENNMVTSVILK